MTTVVFRRPSRQPGPQLPTGELVLQEPPALPEAGGADMSSLFTVLPMVAMSGAMMLMFIQPGRSGPMMYVAGGVMGLAMVGMLVGQMGRSSGQRKKQMKGERRDYLRYLAQMRRHVRRAASHQAQALAWNHPSPEVLWSIAASRRMWERRPTHEDFGEVRIGAGSQRLSVQLTPPQTKPVEDLEPLSMSALRRFTEAYWTVPGLPISIQLRDFARLLIRTPVTDEPDEALEKLPRAFARSLVAQLATFHAPDDLRIVICAAKERHADWEWAKWLPHSQHKNESDGAGGRRLVAENFADVERLLGNEFHDRPRFEDRAAPSKDEPYVVIILDDVALPPTSRLSASGVRNTTVIDVSESLRWVPDSLSLRLRITAEKVQLVGTDNTGKERTSPLCEPDSFSEERCRSLARRLAPFRIGSSVETAEPMSKDFGLTSLLGVGDPGSFDIDAVRGRKSRWDQLRIPIGISENGSPVELDLKEAAQGGMGPHGILIGATGSGKSELLRTLVLALAITHSSEVLNFVLVDFKGGATFLGLEKLPHTSAFITNLAEELPLVDRMQEALQGELVRRQELLRKAGFSAAKDYEKARSEGAPLAPLPSLLVVVDEFSELLTSKRDFIDLFVMIGRLGRSLGVHLLLASQRIDEGRVHVLESHLSYRVGLRTFSAMESRSVIGVPSAYELPSAPGNGYLRIDTTTLIRFKAAYVSAPYRSGPRRTKQSEVQRQLVPYSLGFVEAPEITAPPVSDQDEPESGDSGLTLLDVIAARMADGGPKAHQVWLPPLGIPPTLDELYPPMMEDPVRGLTSSWPGNGGLRVPVGIIDRPTEQRRDPLTADFTGSGGHVGIAGGPQSGKSTLLRTLVTSLAMSHTPREVQFFCLDFGGGSLASLSGLPHVGSVTGRLDQERVARTIAEAGALLGLRERSFPANGIDSMPTFRRMLREGTLPPGADDGFGDLFLIVDGWSTLRQDFEALESSFSELATQGLSYGIHLVVASARWSEIRPWLRDLMGTRFELHLGDPVESEIGMRLAANVPSVPGRGLTREAFHFLTALPRIDGQANDDELTQSLRELGARMTSAWPGSVAPPVRLLPAVLDPAQLPPAEGDIRVPLGLDELQLAPVWHDFATNPHLMLFGDTETGKTSTLRLIAKAIVNRYSPDEARIIMADYRRDLYDAVPASHQLGYATSGSSLEQLINDSMEPLRARVPGPDISPEQLRRRDWWTGPKLFVLVDDYDLVNSSMTNPLQTLMELVPQGAEIGLHLVLARATAGISRSMLMDHVLRRLWDISTPALLFSCSKEEGQFLGDVRPRKLPSGRAMLVTRRNAPLLMQTAYYPADEQIPQ